MGDVDICDDDLCDVNICDVDICDDDLCDGGIDPMSREMRRDASRLYNPMTVAEVSRWSIHIFLKTSKSNIEEKPNLFLYRLHFFLLN